MSGTIGSRSWIFMKDSVLKNYSKSSFFCRWFLYEFWAICLILWVKIWSTSGGIGTIRFCSLDICNWKRLLSGYKTVSFNTSSLLSNNACWTVTFRTCCNTSSLIGKQVVYGLTLSDYQVTIKFKVKHLRVCDDRPVILSNYCSKLFARGICVNLEYFWMVWIG